MPHKIVMPHTMICIHIHASIFLQTPATRLYLNCFQPLSIQIYDQFLHHSFDIILRAFSPLPEYIGLESFDVMKSM